MNKPLQVTKKSPIFWFQMGQMSTHWTIMAKHLSFMLPKKVTSNIHSQSMDKVFYCKAQIKFNKVAFFRKITWNKSCWYFELGHEKVAELLIKKNANVNAAAKNGWTPLFFAAKKGNLAKKFWKRQFDDWSMPESFHWIKWTNTFCLGYEKMIEVLIKNGANVTITTASGETALDNAAEEGNS